MRPQKGKQKLYDAAMRLFESQGYFATTVEQITVEAGVSKGLVYNYFESKEALLAGLIAETTEKMESVAGSLSTGESVEESLSGFIDQFLNYLKTEKHFLKLQLTLLMMPELRAIVAEPQKARADALLRLVTNWFRQAGHTEPKNRARMFMALMDGIALHYLSTYERYPLNAMKPQLMKAARDLCSD